MWSKICKKIRMANQSRPFGAYLCKTTDSEGNWFWTTVETGYNMVGAWLHNRRLLYYRPGILKHTITESAIFEALQENWDTFTDYVCLRGISVYYFKVSQVFACCVKEKVVGDNTGRLSLSALQLQCSPMAWTPPTVLCGGPIVILVKCEMWNQISL